MPQMKDMAAAIWLPGHLYDVQGAKGQRFHACMKKRDLLTRVSYD